MRCRARIILILDLAKWQHGGGIDLLIIWFIGGLYAKCTSLTFRSEKSSLFSVNTFFSHLNPRLLLPHNSLSPSLSLAPPAEAKGGGSTAARHHRTRLRTAASSSPQPRAARGGGAQPRASGGSGRGSAWFGGGIPCWPEKRRNFSFGVVLKGKSKALILNSSSKNSQFFWSSFGVEGKNGYSTNSSLFMSYFITKNFLCLLLGFEWKDWSKSTSGNPSIKWVNFYTHYTYLIHESNLSNWCNEIRRDLGKVY